MAYIVTIDRIQAESGGTRNLFAEWSNDAFDHLDHYKVRWWYSTGDDIGFVGHEEEASWKYSRWTAPDNATKVTVQVLPVSATYTVNDTEVSYWWGEWAQKSIYFGADIPPETPPTPSVTVKDYKLIASLDNLKPIEYEGKTNWIYFEVVRDDQYIVVSEGKAKIIAGHAQFSCDIPYAGGEYKVRAKAVRTHKAKTLVRSPTRNPSSNVETALGASKNAIRNMQFTIIEFDAPDDQGVSEWSDYSSNVHSKPESSDSLFITTCRAQTKTSVYLSWSNVAGAKTYDIEYATKKEYLGSSDASSIVSGIEFTHYEKTGLNTGAEYFFRVRATNDVGSSDWSPIVSVVLGKTPSAPTTWSSSTTCMVGDSLILSWLHNAEDGSTQTYAQIEIYVNDVKETHTIDSTAEEDDNKTTSYTIDTSSYSEGSKIRWRVRTAGVTKDYGDWSIQRTVDVYAVPSLNLAVTDSAGNTVQDLSSFPINISATAGPSTQSPVGYYLTVVANQAYTSTDPIGNHKNIGSGDEVYSKYFDISANPLSVTLSAGDISLQNGISYTIVCTVSMNSGLNASSTFSFTVDWTATSYTPNAELGIDYDSVSAIIRPYCKDNSGALVQNVTLAVYRREIDGSFTEIMSNLNNVDCTFITDPHPALNYARYRVVATDTTTGVISYSDLPLFPVNEKACIIQWNEEWRSFYSENSDRHVEPVWSGSFLRLPYNIDVSNSYAVDSSLVEYIGRKHPISYYGTQLGEGEIWNVVVPKSDIETLYALRRLAVWTGDAYVREPSGSGYWANVGVSFSQKHCDMTVPVTLTIKRVSGGI